MLCDSVTCHLSTDPSFAFTESVLKKGASIRRSLRLNKKDKTAKVEQLQPVSEAPAAEKKEVEVEKVARGIRESYTLSEIPPTTHSGDVSYNSIVFLSFIR